MAEGQATRPVLAALLNALSAQGYGGYSSPDGRQLTAYPIEGTIDLIAVADAIENALGADTPDEAEAKAPAELNAANDG